jgi:hypothetical protein
MRLLRIVEVVALGVSVLPGGELGHFELPLGEAVAIAMAFALGLSPIPAGGLSAGVGVAVAWAWAQVPVGPPLGADALPTVFAAGIPLAATVCAIATAGPARRRARARP